MPQPKKRRKKSAPSDDRQLELPVSQAAPGTVQLPAVVAEAPLGEQAVEPVYEEYAPEENAHSVTARWRRRERRWWHRHWNFAVGLWLVPFAWIFADAFFQTLNRAMSGPTGLPFWMRHEFLMFALGAAAWFLWLGFCIWKWRRPRPTYMYVLGHELTHAAIATLFLGRVHRFRASSDGGYIETNRYNFLIALAPYLWPFYSVPILAAWSLSLLIPGMVHYREIFLAALGFTWMFHLTFTLWMMPKGQTDFRGPGLLFSFTVIYMVNVILLTGALVSLAPSPGWRWYFGQLGQSVLVFYNGVLDALGDFMIAVARWVTAVFA